MTLAVFPSPHHKPQPTHVKKHFPCVSLRCKRAWGRKHHPQPKLHEALASWYGPEDSGGDLACTGQPLTSNTLGVANKTLPCGTSVRLCLEPKGPPCIKVEVVDRGPYVAGREFDLTEATARAVGFLSRGVGPVWVAVG